MQINQLEATVYKLIERIESRQPLEDDHVELKREWIAPQQAARKLAAHANSARGEPILWLIGVDEKAGAIPGAEANELSNWFSRIQAQFDQGVAPELTHHVSIPVKDVTIVALRFLTERSPYVVKNPNGGSPEMEIPWRDGSRTRSAHRSEVLRLLEPCQMLPEVEFVRADLALFENRGVGNFVWSGNLEFYLIPKSTSPVFIAEHRWSVSVERDGVLPRLDLSRTLWKTGQQIQSVKSRANSGAPLYPHAEIVATGPGVVGVRLEAFSKSIEYRQKSLVDDWLTLTLNLSPTGSERAIVSSVLLNSVKGHQHHIGDWKMDSAESN